METQIQPQSNEYWEHAAQAFLLHTALNMSLTENGSKLLEQIRTDAAAQKSIDDALGRMSSADGYGIARMSKEQANRVRALIG